MQAETLEAFRARRMQFVAAILKFVLWVVIQIRLIHPDLVRFQLSEVDENLTRRSLSCVDRTVDVTRPVKTFRKRRVLARM